MGQVREIVLLAALAGFALAAAGCLQKGPQALANDEIQAAFARFQRALEAGDGVAAARELANEAFIYYRGLREAALVGTADELRRMPIDVRYEVLKLRGRMTADELAALDARGLTEQFLSRQWVNVDFLRGLRLGNVIHHDRHAEVRFSDDDGPTTRRLVFRPEADGWKFDLAATAGIQRRLLQSLMTDRGLTEEELLSALLSESVGQRPLDELWLPLQPPGRSTDRDG